MVKGSFEIVHPKGRELVGGDLLAQSLKHLGVSVAFGIHGGHLDAFLLGAIESGIELVDTRHETVAVQAAEGYAKTTGKTGVCFVTANSGYANGVPGILSAYADRSPILVVTSSPPLRDSDTNAMQGFHDQVVVSKSFTKYAVKVTEAEQIPRLVSHAVRMTRSGAPGPSLIDVPIEIMFAPVRVKAISWGSISSPLPFTPGPHPDAIAESIKLLKAAKRPVVVVGTGAGAPETQKALVSFIEKANVPLFWSKWSGLFPLDNPLHGGSAGNLAALASMGHGRPDLIILLGARTGMFTGNRSGAVFPDEDCSYIQVDVDSGEIGRSQPVEVGITADVYPTLLALTAALDGYKASADWVKAATSVRDAKDPFDDAPEVVESTGRLHPYHALKAVTSAIEPGAIFVIDGGDTSLWIGHVTAAAKPSLVVSACGYLGFLGNSFGYSLGVAKAHPDRQVVVFIGDGAFGMQLADIDTYARFKLNILTVLVNNYCWGMSKNGQDALYRDVTPIRSISALSPDAQYQDLASSLNNASAKIEKLADVAPAIRKLSKADGPALINLIVSDKPAHPGTVAMVGYTDSKDVIVVPYYDNPDRPTYGN